MKSFVNHEEMATVHSHVVDEVLGEMVRQDRKWGEQNHDPSRWLAILTEEFGEYGKEVVHAIFSAVDEENYRYEAIQTAAVAIRVVESFDRARGKVIGAVPRTEMDYAKLFGLDTADARHQFRVKALNDPLFAAAIEMIRRLS